MLGTRKGQTCTNRTLPVSYVIFVTAILEALFSAVRIVLFAVRFRAYETFSLYVYAPYSMYVHVLASW